MDAHVEEDKGHDDVVHVALVTGEEDQWNPFLVYAHRDNNIATGLHYVGLGRHPYTELV